MIKKLLLTFGILLCFSLPVYAQFGGNSGPFPANIQVYDDGALVEGSGRSVSFYTNLTATWDSATGYYIIHGAAGSGYERLLD